MVASAGGQFPRRRGQGWRERSRRICEEVEGREESLGVEGREEGEMGRGESWRMAVGLANTGWEET